MSQSINLYTENFSLFLKLKAQIKKFTGRNFGGPKIVEQNLLYGLAKLGMPVKLNEKHQKIRTACVLSGIATLRWAIKEKQKGNIQKIIAGPNIAMPGEFGGIIFNDSIDIFLVPAPWVLEFCASFKPAFRPKFRVWAAGVRTLPDSEIEKTASGRCLIYQKNDNKQLLESISGCLQQASIPFAIMTYGQYRPDEYLVALRDSDFAIFLSDSESQGLALHEAWMANVPTLVWDGGHMRFGKYEWPESSSAPYLSPEAGMFFESITNFSMTLKNFLENLTNFKPRQYHLENFTPEISAKKYLEIINSL